MSHRLLRRQHTDVPRSRDDDLVLQQEVFVLIQLFGISLTNFRAAGRNSGGTSRETPPMRM
jgi:hypothetical protein